jgi:hypothetical protein
MGRIFKTTKYSDYLGEERPLLDIYVRFIPDTPTPTPSPTFTPTPSITPTLTLTPSPTLAPEPIGLTFTSIQYPELSGVYNLWGFARIVTTASTIDCSYQVSLFENGSKIFAMGSLPSVVWGVKDRSPSFSGLTCGNSVPDPFSLRTNTYNLSQTINGKLFPLNGTSGIDGSTVTLIY